MDEREHRGLALTALVAVGLVTVGWWMLALYPAANAPEWLSRTRLTCFGAPPGGLPDAGGWVLLIGQPVGMLGILFIVWGDAVRADLRWVQARRSGRVLSGLTLVAVTWLVLAAALVIRRTTAAGEAFETVAAVPVTAGVSRLMLIDQHGQPFDLRQVSGPALVTFAFGHCATMCPTLVRDVLRIRKEAGREDVPLVVVTVDPWRDDPSRLASIAKAWQLAPGDRLLSGTVDSVNATLDDWGIARQRDQTTGDVVHAMVTFFVHPGAQTATRIDGSTDPLRALLGGSTP
jgi:cytochrome oxidase Cu insertion factor (SCO1/SenC/PrrC family)